MTFTRDACLEQLGDAYTRRELTLYLGAGVSVKNGLPTWEQLVLAMYFGAISEEQMEGWRPFPNYLFAIAEWHLERAHEPLEITARKVRKYAPDQQQFLENLRLTLYEGFREPGGDALQPVSPQALRAANPTLNAVARLCEAGGPAASGVRSVITYNYDSLLESALGQFPHQPIYCDQELDHSRLPIYHVHGYVPMTGPGSRGNELVFTEDQYHLTAQNAYCWSNLVQIQALSRSVGLMIGLSLSDRNMRRLLDAIAGAPVGARNFALLKRPVWEAPDDDALDRMHKSAIKYLERFQQSGVKSDERCRNEAVYRRPGVKSARAAIKSGGRKSEPRYRREIRGILGEVERLDVQQQEFVYEQLGICPIWYDEHEEIPGIVDQLLAAAGRSPRVQATAARQGHAMR